MNSEKVRYNGEIISDEFVEKLKDFADLITVCPEVSIGLGVPRDPLKVYTSGNGYRLFQTKTGLDLTEKIKIFSSSFLGSIGDVDGFLLKGKSPSCGYSGTKIYSNINAEHIIKRGSGLFAMAIKEKFPYIPVEDELRLKKDAVRHHFLTRIFVFAEFRHLKKNCRSISQLIDFHTGHKHLLALYSQKKLNELEKIITGHKKGKLDKTISDYSNIFYSAFKKNPGARKSQIFT